jgi:hypothetical protein
MKKGLNQYLLDAWIEAKDIAEGTFIRADQMDGFNLPSLWELWIPN